MESILMLPLLLAIMPVSVAFYGWLGVSTYKISPVLMDTPADMM